MPTTAKAFLEYVLFDLFRVIEGVTSRPMFGGYALYHHGIIFGIIADDRLYFKADRFTDFYFTERGSEQFTYQSGERTVRLPYWELPAEVADDAEELTQWIERATGVSTKKFRPAKRPSAAPAPALPPSAPRPVRAILFQCYGVITVEPFTDWITSHIADIKQRLALQEMTTLMRQGEVSYAVYLDRLAASGSTTTRAVERALCHSLRVDPAIVHLLALLRPRYRLGLFALGPSALTEWLLQQHGLEKYFDATVSTNARAASPREHVRELLVQLKLQPSAAVFIVAGTILPPAADISEIIPFIDAQQCVQALHERGIRI